jgi:hypothetical protein
MEILQVLQEHLFEIIGGVSIVTFLGVLYRMFIVSVIPKILLWVKKTVIVIISRLFGFEVDEENLETINELPFVKKFNQLVDGIQIQNELKLIEYKQKLSSPLYSDLEKLPIENLYKSLYLKLKPKLSQETQDVLNMLENLNKQ